MTIKTAEAEAYLAAIVTSSDDAIISKDLQGNITSWNPAAVRIFGYSEKEAIGRHISLIIPHEHLPEEENIIATLKAGKRIDHFETVRRRKDGQLVPVSLTVSPIRDTAGNVVGASKIARDISDRIKAEAALREMSAKKDEFLANMSHELRTPMNAVIGLANLLKMMDLPPNAIKFIDTLKLSADNLMELINDLLDFAKIESDSLEIENVEFNLAEQVDKAVMVASVRAREKSLNLYVNYPASLGCYYKGDPLRVYQVLMNLLSNAVKFTDRGSIEVDVHGEPDAALPGITLVTLKVTDTGIGIPHDKLATIFDKFMQADSSITRRYGGSGLGLAIVKALAQKMGGDVQVYSEIGVGTSFTFTLPLQSVPRASLDESLAESTVLPADAGKNVLLVEDYEPNAMVAGEMLSQMGYDYDVARNGFDALRKFLQGHYDVILMDVQMQELDGLEVTRRIRRIETERGLGHTPVIAMTAHVRDQDKSQCLNAGMDDFIPKPFDPRVLAQKMAQHIGPAEEPPRPVPKTA